MFKTVPEAASFFQAVKGKAEVDGVESVICAPFTNLPVLIEAAKGSGIKIGAQNVHYEEQGAYTGEISGRMLQELGVHYVIIGHSERRAYFAETDEMVNKKVHAVFKFGMTPIVCVGEKLEERVAGQTRNVCEKQTAAALSGLTADQATQVVVAYEPIWAIGTGKSCAPQDANEVISDIRGLVAKLYDHETANQIRIQYGGSVKPGNIAEYMDQFDIDGALVGGASLEPDSFIALVEGAR